MRLNSCPLAALAILAFSAHAGAAAVIFSDNFDGLSTALLNGTTPDTTTAGANWIAMQSATNGRILANGTINVADGSSSANRGGSATLAFAPTVGFIYTLDLSAVSLASTASATTAGTLNFGFAKGQSSLNGTAYRLGSGSASVTGQAIQAFYPRAPSTGIFNKSYNDTSASDWANLPSAFGGSIDLRVVLDTSDPGTWTATWYAKRPTTSIYSLTRATENVTDPDITSVGFGFNTFTSGQITSFSLTAEAVPEPGVLAISLLGLAPLLTRRRR